MWRYLPPAVLMVCAALVLIAGATGDLQSWSQSIDAMPSWRTMITTSSWPPVMQAWDSGMALLKRNRAVADAVAAPAAVRPASVAAAKPVQATAAPAHEPVPAQPAAVAPPPATAPAQPQAAASPMQRRLMDARQALTAGRADEARRMLETARAEMAFRPAREGSAMQVDMPATWIGRALSSLKNGDSSGALHELDLAIASS